MFLSPFSMKKCINFTVLLLMNFVIVCEGCAPINSCILKSKSANQEQNKDKSPPRQKHPEVTRKRQKIIYISKIGEVASIEIFLVTTRSPNIN